MTNSATPVICPHCGNALVLRQLQREQRFGVEMTAFNARIVDVIKRAGPDGIHKDDLFGIIYAGRASPPQYRSFTRLIYRINERLEDTPWRLRGHSGLHIWRVVSRSRKARAA